MTPLLRRLLAKDPADRPDLDEIVAELTRVLAAPGPDPAHEEPPDWRPRVLGTLVLIVAAAVAAVMIITAVRPGGETRLPDTSPPPTVAGTSRPPSGSGNPSPGDMATPPR